mmetsp:Transcript_41426/g.103410  ORF Transcript_41426/g.103410 Transcript_41426/m.103410 type:complete len:216 (-) Transcript_41426:142-789(-)
MLTSWASGDDLRGNLAACTHYLPFRNTLLLLLMPKNSTTSSSRQVSPAAAVVLVVPLWWWWGRPCRPRRATRKLTQMANGRRTSRGGRTGSAVLCCFYEGFLPLRVNVCVYPDGARVCVRRHGFILYMCERVSVCVYAVVLLNFFQLKLYTCTNDLSVVWVWVWVPAERRKVLPTRARQVTGPSLGDDNTPSSRNLPTLNTLMVSSVLPVTRRSS